MSEIQSKIDSLQELNSQLIATISELRKENAKIKAENVELKQIIEENVKRNFRVKELEQKNIELETRLAILEQGEKGISTKDVSQSPVNSNNTPDAPSSDVFDNASNSDVYQESLTQPEALITSAELARPKYSIRTETKSPEDKEVDDFHNSLYKERVNKEIIQSIKEKKLRDQNSDLSLVNHNISSAIAESYNNEAKHRNSCASSHQVSNSPTIPHDDQMVEQELMEQLSVALAREDIVIVTDLSSQSQKAVTVEGNHSCRGSDSSVTTSISSSYISNSSSPDDLLKAK
ncbi:12881_t:CDS:2, partial [Ambispora gerdemannii]